MSADLATARTKKIDVAQVRVVLERIAATEPGRRDRRAGVLPARYLDQGQPNCLVALVLHDLGISIGVLRALDREYPTGEIIHAGVRVVESRNPALRRFTPNALKLLDYVQRRQDDGQPWGALIKQALTPDRFTAPWLSRRRKPWLNTEEH